MTENWWRGRTKDSMNNVKVEHLGQSSFVWSLEYDDCFWKGSQTSRYTLTPGFSNQNSANELIAPCLHT
jgi:hypothetical protein